MMAARAKVLLARWGRDAHLLRGVELRPCIAAFLEFNPREQGLALEGARRVYVGAPLDVAPDHELDKLVFNGELYSIVAPVKGPRPAGTPILFDLIVLYEGTYP